MNIDEIEKELDAGYCPNAIGKMQFLIERIRELQAQGQTQSDAEWRSIAGGPIIKPAWIMNSSGHRTWISGVLRDSDEVLISHGWTHWQPACAAPAPPRDEAEQTFLANQERADKMFGGDKQKRDLSLWIAGRDFERGRTK